MSADGAALVTSTASWLLPGSATGHGAKSDETAIASAQKALATANATVAQDRRNNSPACVAVDQKAVDKAATDLAQAKAKARADGVLDITT